MKYDYLFIKENKKENELIGEIINLILKDEEDIENNIIFSLEKVLKTVFASELQDIRIDRYRSDKNYLVLKLKQFTNTELIIDLAYENYNRDVNKNDIYYLFGNRNNIFFKVVGSKNFNSSFEIMIESIFTDEGFNIVPLNRFITDLFSLIISYKRGNDVNVFLKDTRNAINEIKRKERCLNSGNKGTIRFINHEGTQFMTVTKECSDINDLVKLFEEIGLGYSKIQGDNRILALVLALRGLDTKLQTYHNLDNSICTDDTDNEKEALSQLFTEEVTFKDTGDIDVAFSQEMMDLNSLFADFTLIATISNDGRLTVKKI